jgi:outer membrane protein assembly factor BamD (BamD/ComL family)
MARNNSVFVLLFAAVVAGCSTTGTDTLESLKNKTVTIEKDAPVSADVDTAIKTYEEIIDTTNDAALTEKALRHLGDLEMQRIDRMYESSEGNLVNSSSYDKAIDAYQKLLIRFPRYPDREGVIYQLARAYEHSDRVERAIKALKIFIRDYPASPRAEEVGFRLGELLFQEGRYADAETAYATIVGRGRSNNRFYEQALFKYAWSIYKQDRCRDSIDPFFSVLDLKLMRNAAPSELARMDFISRSDREIVNDSLRAIDLCISMQRNPDFLKNYLRGKPPRVYEFMLYESLAKFYLDQKRPEDAAHVYSSFFERSPWHPYGVLLHDKAIDIYTSMKSKEEIIAAKKEFVRRYDILSESLDRSHHNDYNMFLVKSDTESLNKIHARLKVHLVDIAEYHHALAQKTESLLDFQKAIKWYRLYLKYFPVDKDSPHINFLLAEALFQDKLYDEAAHEYERTAYQYGVHPDAAEAGYAALVAYTEQDKLLQGQNKTAWQQSSLQSALNFAKIFSRDPRAPAVLAKAAHELYEARNYHDAMAAAQTIIDRYPKSGHEVRRTALIVLANTQFELSNYEIAELYYMELRAMIKGNDPLQTELKERIAACIYKQAEHLRAQGAISSAIAEFKRLIETVPDSSVRPIAEYDIAATYIIIDQWKEAVSYLEEFKKKYPGHPLSDDVDEKLAVAYVRLEDPLKAADALKGLVAKASTPEAQRDALWQAAQLYDKGGEKMKAANTYIAYADMFPSPLESAIEANYKAALLHQQAGHDYNYRVQLEKIYEADRQGGDQRTNRTRYLAAKAAFVLAEPLYERYANVRLVEPIRKNMQLKKQLMEQTLAAYNKAAELNVAEFTTAATYRIADMYVDFSHKLMDSDRPANLNDEEMEQYEIMLEEQAFPFEEKAIGLFETNVARMNNGLYDEWIQKTIAALAELVPARYAREEQYDIAAETVR